MPTDMWDPQVRERRRNDAGFKKKEKEEKTIYKLGSGDLHYNGPIDSLIAYTDRDQPTL